MNTNYINIAKDVILKESEALQNLSQLINNSFNKALDLLYNCRGKVVISGVGKSGHIAAKIAATLSSTGTPAFFMNPNEGLHGDVGVIVKNDVMIAISKTGETSELLTVLSYPKRMQIPIISITSDNNSSLGKLSDVILLIPDINEVCPMNLAPTTSTTLTLVLGDALAVALMEKRGFKKDQFAQFHPGGSLGKKLRKIHEFMIPISDFAVSREDITVMEALSLIIQKNKGICVFLDNNDHITGIIVDGDIKRLLLKHPDLLEMKAHEVMVKNPKIINENELILNALNVMDNKYDQLVVVDNEDKLVGIIHIKDMLKGQVI